MNVITKADRWLPVQWFCLLNPYETILNSCFQWKTYESPYAFVWAGIQYIISHAGKMKRTCQQVSSPITLCRRLSKVNDHALFFFFYDKVLFNQESCSFFKVFPYTGTGIFWSVFLWYAQSLVKTVIFKTILCNIFMTDKFSKLFY